MTIGSGVKDIYNRAFAYCYELKDVYCLAVEVPTMYDSDGCSGGTDAFKYSYIENTTLHVPAASVEAYGAVEPWSGFKEIVGIVNKAGDVNSDNVVDVADIASVISVMSGTEAGNKEAADVNDDGVVDVADIATILTRMASLSRMAEDMEE